jgi:hypothetical protein
VAAKYYDCVLVPNLPKDKPNIQYRIVKTSRSKGGGRYAETKNGVLALLKEWKMTGTATEKSIPSWVFQLPDEQIATFLRVFVDCDGWFDDGHATGSPSVNVMLANPLLVRQLGQLALRLGIPGTYRSKENDNAGAWGWSSPHVDEWQRRIGSSVKKEVLARAVENKVLFESQSVRRWKTWRTARPVNGQKFADCPQGYEWRKIISIRRSVAPTIAVEVHNDNHAFVSDVVEHNTSIMRLLMTQLCKIRVRVLLLNPHYTRYDRDSGEDWTPFEKYLEKSPMECAEYAKIGECLQWMAKTELPKRIQRVREGKAAGRPFFVVVDELPAIVGEVRDAPVYISKLLREGRKYGIFLIVASQDFLVKTTGMDGGAVRKCFRTAFYVGGDGATARALLETGSPIAETKLGKGVIAIRCKDTQEAVEARVPYVDNDSVYQMLGPSTFADGRSQTDELNEDDLSYSQLYEQMTSSRPREDVVVDSPAQERMQPLPTPIIQERGPRAADIDLAVAITLWNAGYNSENKLMRAFPGLVKNQAHLLRERILGQANAKQEEVE